jgi:hypothetical protein
MMAMVHQRLLDPRGTVETKKLPVTPRLDDLNGKRLSILTNNKPNSEYLFEQIEKEFKQRFRLASISKFEKYFTNIPVEQHILDGIIKESDFVINGLGD